ncbi:hypothetical protein N7520_011369 [Penicillium odoratum]|uniref:uncharacterized protein n=1 Tax=Penicillium odoratum TaxID=1167516 RepID=UPI0025485C66|nr:uncharacterized protein N7520_011369 [Penicillium odoratum]KAJ5746187.1 hypothetical protein N7520_011369 [Penicillium odoratum]
MSLLNHGGRIVPIVLAGHQQQHGSTESSVLNTNSPSHPNPPSNPSSLLDQQDDIPAVRQPKTMDFKCLEMPCLTERGLFALPTEGDGNCLYYSLSDQLKGTFSHADEIRQILAAHMANNRTYFMQFVVAQGGERRRPKRATASAYATRSADVSCPSEEDKERRFEEMVALTRKNGEWGSSEHLQAFCQVFKVDINVYTMDGVQMFRDVHAMPDEHRDAIHVAFHDFKHYSSVRTIGGCHTGLLAKSVCIRPLVTSLKDGDSKDEASLGAADVKATAADTKYIPSTENDTSTTHQLSPSSSFNSISTSDTKSTNTSVHTKDPNLAVDVSPPWDIQTIQDAFGGRYDHDTIRDMLQKCRGDIDRAFAELLGEKNDSEKNVVPGPSFKSNLQVSRSSSPFSTGSKRSADDSDDSEDPRPAVRRGRPRKRLVSNLTLGVGISFRDDQNEVVSLNLRMKANAEKAAEAEKTRTEAFSEDSEQSETTRKGPRRSGRLSKSRSA